MQERKGEEMKVCTERRAWQTAASTLLPPPPFPTPLVQTLPTHSPCSGGAVCLFFELSPSVAPSKQGVHLVLRLIHYGKLLYSPAHAHCRHCQSIPICVLDPLEPQSLISSRHRNLGNRSQSTGIGTRDKKDVSPSIYLLLI